MPPFLCLCCLAPLSRKMPKWISSELTSLKSKGPRGMKAKIHKYLNITGLYEVVRHLVPIAAASLSVHYWLLTVG